MARLHLATPAFLLLISAFVACAGAESDGPNSASQAIRWLDRSQAELRRGGRLPPKHSFPPDWPDDEWWQESLRVYLDAGDAKGAWRFLSQWHMKFGQPCGRDAIRLMSLHFASQGRFNSAVRTATKLVELPRNHPLLLGFSPAQNERLCVTTLVDISRAQADAADAKGAARTAAMIPKRRYKGESALAYRYAAAAAARRGDASLIDDACERWAADVGANTNDVRLGLISDLAGAGAHEAALEMADGLPASGRRTAQSRIALAQAISGNTENACATAQMITNEESQRITLLKVAAILAWRGELDAAQMIVDHKIQSDQVSHPHRSVFYRCREVLAMAIAWSGDEVGARSYADEHGGDSRAGSLVLEIRSELFLHPLVRPPRERGRPLRPLHPPLRISSLRREATSNVLGAIASAGSSEASLASASTLVLEPAADDFKSKTQLYALLGAAHRESGDREQAARYFGRALDAADETDFDPNYVDLAYLLPAFVSTGEADRSFRYLKRAMLSMKNRRRRSELLAHLGYAFASSGNSSQVEKLLALAPRQPDRALICVGAAAGCLDRGDRAVPPLPRDAYEMLARCGLE